MPLLDTARGSFYYADHWRGHGVPLLLIHGAAGTHLDWPMPVRRLRSLAVDLSGHGKSSGDGHATVEEHAADMLTVLDALAIEQAYVCGHSMGGAVALTLALHAPARVRGLILVASGARMKVHPDILEQAEANPAGVAELLASWLWSPDATDATRDRGRAAFLAQHPAVVARDFQAANAFDLRPRLADIHQPTLVLCGTADVMTPPKFSQTLADTMPNATLKLYEGAGHTLQLERAADVAAAIDEFMT